MNERDASPETIKLSLYNLVAGLAFIGLTIASLVVAILAVIGVMQHDRNEFIIGGFIMAACFGVLTVFVIITWVRIWRWNSKHSKR